MFYIVLTNVLLLIVFASIVFTLNFYLLWSIFYSKRITFKPDLILIYFRFAADVGYNVSVTIKNTYYLACLNSRFFVVKNLTLYLLCPTLLCSTMRATLAFFISFDKVLASFFPILYHNHRRKIRDSHIFLLVFCSAFFDQYILFGYCENVFDVPLECDTFSCSVNKCYQDYWVAHDQLFYFLIGTASVLLFFRLCIWNHCATTQSNQLLSRATQIALLDALMTLIFNIIPLFIYANFPSINLKTVGPMTSVSKTAGCLIESIIICRVLFREKRSVTASPNILVS